MSQFFLIQKYDYSHRQTVHVFLLVSLTAVKKQLSWVWLDHLYLHQNSLKQSHWCQV